uniref:Uncharacterized protein n=1 Tax=Cacopsylla melanoneura TaxID=428564 RepID=A0A8D8XNF5_9HEMI
MPPISSGTASLPMGTTLTAISCASSVSYSAAANLVLVIPGARQLTRMFSSAKSCATALVRPNNAVLLTEYAPRSLKGANPPIEDTYTIEPPFLFLMYGRTSCVRRNVLFTFTSNILSHAFSGHSITGPVTGLTAAFETKISIPPNCFSA